MGFEVSRIERGDAGIKFRVTERLYINAAKDKLVPENSPEAAYVYATPGKTIPMEDAVRLGLAEPPAEKQRAKPAADKQRRPARNKTKGGAT